MILDVYPEAADKVFTLKEFADYDEADWDISDPLDIMIRSQCLCRRVELALLKILDKL